MTTIVDAVAQLTPEWMTDALRASGVLAGSVATAETDVLGVGQLGLVVRVGLTYDGDAGAAPASVMVKLPREDPGSRHLGVAMRIYEAEVRFYQQIAPTVAVATPRLYWGDLEPETGRFTLVLEDLSPVGEPGDMIAGGTVDQAAKALEALVALQAPRWNDPGLRAIEWLADPQRSAMLFAGVEPTLPAFVERFGDRLGPHDVALLERIAPKANAWAAGMLAGDVVVVHGDYRMDNMIFPHDAAAPVHVFDWQATRLGPPLVDAAVYLGGCLRPDERRAHERDLLREYHAGLVAGGVSGLGFDAVWDAYRNAVFWGLMLAVPMSMQLERTDRGDALFAGMVRTFADFARDLDSEATLP